MRDCKECVNCTYVRGFMCTCNVSYDEEREDGKWHIQEGKYCHRNTANKCEHYTTEMYDRDKIFVI